MAGHFYSKAACCLLPMAFSALAPIVASAQTADIAGSSSAALEEVSVSAERYRATVQTTPVAVTAISAATLADRQIGNVLEAASEIPGTVIMPNINSSNNARIVMRGAGQENSGINFDQAVGVYIDDVIQPRV